MHFFLFVIFRISFTRRLFRLIVFETYILRILSRSHFVKKNQKVFFSPSDFWQSFALRMNKILERWSSLLVAISEDPVFWEKENRIEKSFLIVFCKTEVEFLYGTFARLKTGDIIVIAETISGFRQRAPALPSSNKVGRKLHRQDLCSFWSSCNSHSLDFWSSRLCSNTLRIRGF